MEVLPAIPEQIEEPKQRNPRAASMMKPGKPYYAKGFRFQTLTDAMRIAQENVRDPDWEDDDPDPYGFAQELEEKYHIDLGLEPRWRASPNDALWQRRMKGRARKTAVAKMYLEGFTTDQIANKCKVSQSTIYRDLEAITQEWRRSYLNDIEVLAARDLARLDYMINRLSPAIDNGDVKAINSAVEIIRERGNILGYRQGVQVDIEQHIRETAEAQGLDPEKALAVAQRISIRYR